MTFVRVTALAACFQFVLTYAPVAVAQQPAAQPVPQAPGRGRGPIPVDPRVQMREYVFTDTNENIEVPGGDHGNVIGIGMPDIFQFFAQHSKPASR